MNFNNNVIIFIDMLRVVLYDTCYMSHDTTHLLQGDDREFSLDGEGYEVRPVTVRALPRAVMIFAPPLPAAAP